MDKKSVTLSQKELKRLKVLERIKSGAMDFKEGAQALGVTERQLRRLRQKYEAKGAQGLIHGNKGRRPSHALSEAIKIKLVNLYDEKYHDSNYTHCSELLEEHDSIELSPSSVGRILKSSGYENKRSQKRRPKQHSRRERRSQAGMLWQTDATPYEWLGKKFGKFALHSFIDDATSIVTCAHFTENECGEGYSTAMTEGIKQYGVPLAVYSDKHTIFRSPNEKLSIEQELDGQQIPLSNFGKAMAELGIEHIKAHSPQAKGRVERLWGTFQDRLPVELRLMNAETIEAANKALPALIAKHNALFSVIPADDKTAYAPLDDGVNLNYVFALRETRKIGGGNSISYKKGVYVPVKADKYAFNAKTIVEVRETMSGEVILWHEGKSIALRRLDKRPSADIKEPRKDDGRVTLQTVE